MPKQFERLHRDRHAARRINKQVFWTNPSVKALSGDEDPIAVITEKARDLVFKTIEDGWQGSPFDPFWFAEYRHLAMTPRDDIPDARLIPESSTRAGIEFYPKQPKARVSFSLAHEIGQTLFPDFGLTIRNRLKCQSAIPQIKLESSER
ncbi:MAG: hypothetical protein K0S89_696 [Nitrososphaeraceae archaeon]|nr:hypothetical protein [Nitrososphaeraceae archaeon]